MSCRSLTWHGKRCLYLILGSIYIVIHLVAILHSDTISSLKVIHLWLNILVVHTPSPPLPRSLHCIALDVFFWGYSSTWYRVGFLICWSLRYGNLRSSCWCPLVTFFWTPRTCGFFSPGFRWISYHDLLWWYVSLWYESYIVSPTGKISGSSYFVVCRSSCVHLASNRGTGKTSDCIAVTKINRTAQIGQVKLCLPCSLFKPRLSSSLPFFHIPPPFSRLLLALKNNNSVFNLFD